MNTTQYVEFRKYVPIMVQVWNTVPGSDTDITHFQVEHGMSYRSIVERILQQPPAEGLPASSDDLNSIVVSVNVFIRTNHKRQDFQTAIRLNADGTRKVGF